jgi:hypothetical protein
VNSTLISDQSEAHSSISLRLSVPSDRPPLFGGGIRGDASERRFCRYRLMISQVADRRVENRRQEHSEERHADHPEEYDRAEKGTSSLNISANGIIRLYGSL